MSLLALLLVAAQHQGHDMPAALACTADHAAMGHCEMPKPEASPSAEACSPEHAAMGHCTMPEQSKPEEPACSPEHAAMGHCALPATDAPGAGDAPPPPAPRVGTADAIFGADVMGAARAQLYAEHGGGSASKIMLDQAEVRVGRGSETYVWDAEAWFGGDIDKLVVKSEGEGAFGGTLEGGEVQALWGRAVGPYFDFQAGIRQDFGPGASPTYAVVGFEGLAPYWFDIEGALFVSQKGDLTGRFEASYDQRITQSLIVQPWTELNFAAQDVTERGVGAGVSSVELGLRLRYEIQRELAPYVGFVWERKVGKTARFARSDGEYPSRPAFVAGVRFWF